jgi:hypothetical protein
MRDEEVLGSTSELDSNGGIHFFSRKNNEPVPRQIFVTTKI